jgi:hypothetical protein
MRSEVQVAAQPAYPDDAIPTIARTRGGVVFDPSQDRWSYREGVKTISLEFAGTPSLSPRMRSSLKRALLWYAENSSPSHLQNMHAHFLRLAECLASSKDRVIDEITDLDVLNYKASLPAERAWYLGVLSGFLKKWHRLGFPGVSSSAAGLLNELRLKGNPHGVAVLTMDPLVGPFTPIEQEALQGFVNEAFAQGILDEEVYLLAWLFMALGARPAQYAALKVGDLRKDVTSSGEATFTLKVPRVKQRNKGPRELFKDRTLVPQIGSALYDYAQRVKATFELVLDDPEEAPLFPATKQSGRVASTPEYAFHDTARGLSSRLIAALNALDIPSERTGESLNITPQRFRRTLGTRAAQEGYGELIIAELLDHTDTQHVGAYVGSIPEIAERIDRAVAMTLAPLAQAFAGVLISDESEASSSRPSAITTETLNRAAQLIQENYEKTTAYRVGRQLQMIAEFLSTKHLLTVPVIWRNHIKRISDGARVGVAFDLRRQEKLPSATALDALARIFNLATEPNDVLVSSIAAILCAAPDRINEVLHLEYDCEVRQSVPSTGNTAYGLRWRPSKGADSMIKWLVGSMASVVHKAIANIREITDPARAIAKWYEDNPKKLYLPVHLEHLRQKQNWSLQELNDALFSTKNRGVPTWCRYHKVPMLKHVRKITVAFVDVERAVLAMLPPTFPIADAERGLKYSEALCLVQKNTFHDTRANYRCMMDLTSAMDIASRLGGRSKTGVRSIFDRFGFCEADGSPIHIRTHQFRHYLNTLAQAGGLSQLDIAKWSGRVDVGQNKTYDHVSDRDLNAMVRQVAGQSSQLLATLPAARKATLIPRDKIGQLKLTAAHTTEYGYCIHDYTMLPCQLHRDCLNCTEQVCVKGEATKEANLRQLVTETRALLAAAESARRDGEAGADRWVDHQRLTLSRAQQLVEILDDPEVPDGSAIQLRGIVPASRLEQAVVQRRLNVEQAAVPLLAHQQES